MQTFTPEERADFQAELSGINLRRILWIGGTGVVLDAIFVVCNQLNPLLRVPNFTRDLLFDLAVSAVFLPAVWWISRAGQSAWKRRCVLGYVILQLAVMDAYHFNLAPDFGPTPAYLLGVMIVGGVLLLEPAVVAPILLANHLVYAAMVIGWERWSKDAVAELLGGSAGVIVAAMTSWFLFTTKLSDFKKERLIAERNRELAEANAAMNEVMAIAAHDLRSPLHVLRSLLELVRTDEQLAPERRAQMLGASVRSCDEMGGLLERLLLAHAAEHAADGGRLRHEGVDLRAACEAAAERARIKAEQKQQRIVLRLPKVEAIAAVDAESLGQVLDNLLGNALKFSPPGAEVECALVAAETGGERGWRIEVGDCGPGVPEEERGKLFQKFFRGSPRPTGQESSTGLGLHIVKTLVEAMGGRVSYRPREGGGAVFAVELPQAVVAGDVRSKT